MCMRVFVVVVDDSYSVLLLIAKTFIEQNKYKTSMRVFRRQTSTPARPTRSLSPAFQASARRSTKKKGLHAPPPAVVIAAVKMKNCE